MEVEIFEKQNKSEAKAYNIYFHSHVKWGLAQSKTTLIIELAGKIVHQSQGPLCEVYEEPS